MQILSILLYQKKDRGRKRGTRYEEFGVASLREGGGTRMRDERRARNFCLDIITDIIAVYGIPQSPSVSYADSSLRREPWISSELFNFLFRVSHFYLIKKIPPRNFRGGKNLN